MCSNDSIPDGYEVSPHRSGDFIQPVANHDSNPVDDGLGPLFAAMRDSNLPKSIFDDVVQRLSDFRWLKIEVAALRAELAEERDDHLACERDRAVLQAELERVTTERDAAIDLLRKVRDEEHALGEHTNWLLNEVIHPTASYGDYVRWHDEATYGEHDAEVRRVLGEDDPDARVATSEQETPREQSPQAAADEWNDAHPIGTPVWYWPGLREDGIEAEHSTTRTAASVLGGHTAVVWVEGRGDCIALTHVEASEQETSGTTTFHCYVCDAPDGECDREEHRARDEQEADDA